VKITAAMFVTTVFVTRQLLAIRNYKPGINAIVRPVLLQSILKCRLAATAVTERISLTQRNTHAINATYSCQLAELEILDTYVTAQFW